MSLKGAGEGACPWAAHGNISALHALQPSPLLSHATHQEARQAHPPGM